MIERPSLPTAFNVRVDSAGISGIKSVVFELDGAQAKTENTVPWALGGDINGDDLATTIATGSHKIVARAYQGPNASGTELAKEQNSFVLRA